MTKFELVEYLCVRDSACLCDKLIQSLMQWEDLTNRKIKDDIMLTLDHLLRTLRSGEAELLDKMVFESDEQ